MLENVVQSQLRGLEGKIQTTMTPLTDLTATMMNKVTAMKKDMGANNEQLMNKTMEVQPAVK